MGYPTTTSHQSTKSRLNLTASTQVSLTPGYLYTLAVVTGPCSVYDSNGTVGAGAANLIYTTSTASGVYTLNFPLQFGLLVVPAGGTAAVSYE